MLLKACHKDLRQRYPSADAMLADLELLQRGQSVQRKHAAERRIAFARRILAPVLLVAVLAGGGWYWSNSLAPRNSEQRQSAADPARRAEAQKLYEQAKTYPRSTREGVNTGIELLNRAISLDSDFAAAYAELSQFYWEAGFAFTPKHSRTEARKNALRAVELDDSLSMAHTILGCVLYDYDWEFKAAEARFQRAIQASQRDRGWRAAYAHSSYAMFLSALGRFTEADEVLEQGERIVPNTQIIAAIRCWRFHFEHRFEDSIREANRLLSLHPNDPVGLERLAFAHERLGHFDDALALALRDNEVAPGPDSLAVLSFVQARMGRREEVQKILDDMRAKSQARPDWTAQILVGLGENDRALEQLQQAVEQHFIGPSRIRDPIWDDLRSDLRFQALLKKMGLKN